MGSKFQSTAYKFMCVEAYHEKSISANKHLVSYYQSFLDNTDQHRGKESKSYANTIAGESVRR
jgi:hypothetical protein